MNYKIFTVIPFVLLAMVLGILAGLFRMGWILPVEEIIMQHGAIMIGSFLGTLIILERVVALKQNWMYGIPIISGISIILFWFGQDNLAMYFISIGSIGLIYIYYYLIIRYKEIYYYVMGIGAIMWLVGNVALIINPLYPAAVPWWIAFILFTIVGERMELSKFLPRKKYKNTLLFVSIAIYTIGLLMPDTQSFNFGESISGVGLIAIAIWLFKYDIARMTAKTSGIHKYTGSLLLTGYVWLLLTGIMLLLGWDAPLAYDAVLHSFFLGFTFFMIFAHAPIIFPGVAGLSFRPYHPTLYIWTVLLFITLSGRIIGDIMLDTEIRKIFGMLNALIILFFFVNLFILMVIEYRKTPKIKSKKN